MPEQTLKTREEYLIEFEKKLLEILRSLYKSVNQNFILAYGLSLLVAMVLWGSVNELSFLGSKIIVSNRDMLMFMPIIVSTTYILINYELIKISVLYREINRNGSEILSLNKDAMPITVRNISLFAEGMTGFILSLSRWQAYRLLKSSPFRLRLSQLMEGSWLRISWRLLGLIIKFVHWPINLLVRSIVIVCLFFLPVLLLGYYQYKEFFYHNSIALNLPLFSFSILIITAISTAFCGLMLFISYFIDLIENFKKEFEESAIDAGTYIAVRIAYMAIARLNWF